MSDRRRLFVLLASAAILSGLGLSGFAFSATHKTAGEWGLSAFAKYVTIPGATRVGSKTCVNCHSDLSSNFSHAFHAQQGLECEDCHGPGSLHVAGNGDVSKIISFSTRSAKEANGVCLSCHVQDEKLRAWMAGPHASNAVRCTDCHQIHAPALRAANTERMSFDTSTRGAFRARLVSPETNVAVRTESETNEACLK